MPEAPLPARGINWGIVGYGWVARDYAAPAILAAGHSLHAVCDPTPAAQAAARALAPAAAIHGELAPLLADPALDAIYVATPNHLHRAAVEAAAAAGKAVLCEKPMAATLADAEAMAASVARGGILYGTAFDQRHHPAHAAIREAVSGGLIGTPTAIRIAYACWLGPAWSVTGEGDNWRADPARAGGGALMDLAPHGLDLAEYLLGERIEEIAALTQRRVQDYTVDDGALLIGRTTGGVLVQLHVAYNCPDALPRRRLEVLGAAGQILAENTMGQDPGGRVTHTDAAGQSRPLPVPDENASPFARQMAAFARALSTGDRTTFSAERDLHTMRLLHRAYAEDPVCR
ncbi:Gfo/Idh/MocA family protein [Muricoccus pecuniae]|uniref:Putative dehydrogenase n=1 Tax=Muricoccus pecuniae TaxID=693023 RepID=A0A840YEM0_9PROT|nr:Gfo/Idh/MocA family oxidoreductase [Roseomonas pecuniae]MBB5692324.1 putative dehydrogenase [Roseomonas pecuniae]